MDKYLMDANIFIEAKNRYYQFEFCPGFWQSLLAFHEEKKVASIDKVRDELLDQNDELSDWVKNEVPSSGFFKKTESQTVIEKYTEIMEYVYSLAQYMPEAKDEFASGADGWLIAYAAVYGYVVVTHEQYAPAAKATVPLPNVAEYFGVQCKDTFEMLCALKAKFIRNTKR